MRIKIECKTRVLVLFSLKFYYFNLFRTFLYFSLDYIKFSPIILSCCVKTSFLAIITRFSLIANDCVDFSYRFNGFLFFL